MHCLHFQPTICQFPLCCTCFHHNKTSHIQSLHRSWYCRQLQYWRTWLEQNSLYQRQWKSCWIAHSHNRWISHHMLSYRSVSCLKKSEKRLLIQVLLLQRYLSQVCMLYQSNIRLNMYIVVMKRKRCCNPLHIIKPEQL